MGDWVYDDPVELDETRPRSWRIPTGTTRLWLHNPDDRPLDEQALLSALERRAPWPDVRDVGIDYGSQLRSPWIARFFPNLEAIGLANRAMERLDELASCPRLRKLVVANSRARGLLAALPRLSAAILDLEIHREEDVSSILACRGLERVRLVKWKWPDLGRLQGLATGDLVLAGGVATSVRGFDRALDHAWFLYCLRLTSLAGLRAKEVLVMACNRLDLQSLSEVRGLRRLEINSFRCLESLAFLPNCDELRSLTIAATPVRAMALGSIGDAPKLSSAFVAMAKNHEIASAALANPRVTITNGRVCYQGSRQLPVSVYYGREKASWG